MSPKKERRRLFVQEDDRRIGVISDVPVYEWTLAANENLARFSSGQTAVWFFVDHTRYTSFWLVMRSRFSKKIATISGKLGARFVV